MLVTVLSLHRLCRTLLLSAWPSTTQTRPPASGMSSVSLGVVCMDLIICLQGFIADLQPCSGNPCSLCTQLSLSPPPAPIWVPSSRLIKKAHCAGATCPRRHSSAECLRKSHQEALGKLFREDRIETSLLQGSHSTEDLGAVSERVLSPLSGSCLALPAGEGVRHPPRATFAVRLAAAVGQVGNQPTTNMSTSQPPPVPKQSSSCHSSAG